MFVPKPPPPPLPPKALLVWLFWPKPPPNPPKDIVEGVAGAMGLRLTVAFDERGYQQREGSELRAQRVGIEDFALGLGPSRKRRSNWNRLLRN